MQKFLKMLIVALFVSLTLLFIACTEEETANGNDYGDDYDYVDTNDNGFPQFIVIGSDDNTHAEAFRWMAEVMSGKRGLDADRGTNFDGSPRFMSFYVNTSTGWTGNNTTLADAALHAYNLGHSIGNHTHRHSRFVGGTNWNAPATGNHPNNHTIRMSLRAIYNAIDSAQTIMEAAGIPRAHQFGFRTPFLAYSDSAFTAMRAIGMLYDCSIESPANVRPGTTNFPYTLDNGSPDNEANWWSRQQTFNINGEVIEIRNEVRSHPGLWLLPASQVRVHPSDLANVIAKRPSWMTGDLVTGFDYNLWNQAMMDEDETVRALMHTLRLHLNGNRAPFTFGPHSQFFFTLPNMFPNINLEQRQRAFERFVAYASELENVWFVTGDMVIAWMKNPVPASEFDPRDFHRDGRLAAVRPAPDTSIDIDYIDANPQF